jgi:hypothetical protein
MFLEEMARELKLTLITPEVSVKGIQVKAGYSCDLLSWVLAHGESGMAWVTVMTHLNVVAVAMLMEMACIIVPEGIRMEDASLQKAREEGSPVFSSAMTAYEICGRMYALGIGATQKQ